MSDDNPFIKIINNELKAKKLYEDSRLIAIEDINPIAPIHILVITKALYTNYDDFIDNASDHDVVHYFRTITYIARRQGAKSYRLICNQGSQSGQTIFHFHSHIISGIKQTSLINKNL